jgi:hypothetical protein
VAALQSFKKSGQHNNPQHKTSYDIFFRNFTMAAPAEPTGTPIEALFRPSTRLRDELEDLPFFFREIELLPHLTFQDILATGITWKNFCRYCLGDGDQIAWMAPGVYICFWNYHSIDHCTSDPVVLYVSSSEYQSEHGCLRVNVREGTAAAAATATCDFLVILLSTTEDVGVTSMEGCSTYGIYPLPVSAATLSRILQESRNLPRTFILGYATLNEEQIRALETASSPDVEVVLSDCSPADDAGCLEAFVECLQSDGCPIGLKLTECTFDCQVLATALTGNSRVTRLQLAVSLRSDAYTAVLFAALANNKSLLLLNLNGHPTSDANLSLLCQSLRAHPTLTSLALRDIGPASHNGRRLGLADEKKAQRTSLVVEMMQANTVLQTIHFSDHERDDQIYTENICPRLETNLFRPRVLAVKKTADRPFREKILGRALYSVRSNPNLVWMFLSQNVDAFARSEEEEEHTINEETVVEEAVVVEESAVSAVSGSSKRKRSID